LDSIQNLVNGRAGVYNLEQPFSPVNPYNRATTWNPIICQFRKNVYSISTVLAAGYKKVENCATDSMSFLCVAGLKAALKKLIED
jgi:hypothetical protein